MTIHGYLRYIPVFWGDTRVSRPIMVKEEEKITL